jgi:GNAT superfamily N-acetyltransferase
VSGTLTVSAQGVTDLPPGKIATNVTYLQMTASLRERPERPSRLVLDHVPNPDIDWYRALYAEVGEDLLWFSRRVMDDATLRSILGDPRVDVFVLLDGAAEIGLLELDRRVEGEVEIAFFGLVPGAVGTGAGRFLMNRALRRAWSWAPRRVIVHTCSFDHPAALPFYIRSGFVPYKLAIEIGDDPRLTGALPREAAPQIPLIDPAG